MTADVTVILVSDYKPGEEKSWTDFRKALAALAAQDYAGAFEVLLIEEEKYVDAIPPDLFEILPGLRVVPSIETNSYALANFGVERAETDSVILLDADCVPAPGWLSAFVRALQTFPDAAVVSGLTHYPGRTLTERCLAMLLRSYVDPGGRGYTNRISNNNAGFRRAAFLRAPLPTNAGVYASRLQAQAMQRLGEKLVFEPDMDVTHDFEGWPMERDARQSMAHGLITVRRHDPSIPFAWVLKLGVLGISLIVAGRFAMAMHKCLTVAGNYGIRPWQVPYAMLLAVRVHLMEIPGLLKGLRGEPITDTVYR